jgi:hypothetical protein
VDENTILTMGKLQSQTRRYRGGLPRNAEAFSGTVHACSPRSTHVRGVDDHQP